MSMAGKIYGIVGLLVLVAAVIAGVSIYGLREINASTGQMDNLAKRSLNLNTFAMLGLTRSVGVLRMIVTTDDDIIRQLRERYLAATEEGMKAEMAAYVNNLPANPPPDIAARPRRVQALWDEFMKASNETADIAVVSSNARALAITKRMAPFWEETFKTMEDIIRSIPNNAAADVVAWRGNLRNARTDITSYRLTLLQIINSGDLNESAALEKTARAFMDSVVRTIRDGESLSAPYAARATALLDSFNRTVVPNMTEVLRLGGINSSEQALLLYRNRVDPAFENLNAYTHELIEDARVHQEDAIAHTVQLGAAVTWTSLVVSVAGIVLGALLAWITISRITGKLADRQYGLNE